MKKEYVKPQIEVIKMICQAKLTYGSGSLAAREFDDIWEEEADDLEP
jgi:hypothetical protein